ncbi:MAG: hypothetical protein D5R98_07240 [Desulfonatronovibrio sp. MSAO_Bac4]|nr:MAG: hypothetical protein D5R98_07240 [Desulfonatronovibrio sp. MSAO_Bac4]
MRLAQLPARRLTARRGTVPRCVNFIIKSNFYLEPMQHQSFFIVPRGDCPNYQKSDSSSM